MKIQTGESTCTRCGGHQFRSYCIQCDPNYPKKIALLKAERDTYKARAEKSEELVKIFEDGSRSIESKLERAKAERDEWKTRAEKAEVELKEDLAVMEYINKVSGEAWTSLHPRIRKIKCILAGKE